MSRAALTAVLAGAALLAAPLGADASPYRHHWHAYGYAPMHAHGHGFGFHHHRFAGAHGYGYHGGYAWERPLDYVGPSYRPVTGVAYVPVTSFRPMRVYYTPQQQPFYNVPPYLGP